MSNLFSHSGTIIAPCESCHQFSTELTLMFRKDEPLSGSIEYKSLATGELFVCHKCKYSFQRSLFATQMHYQVFTHPMTNSHKETFTQFELDVIQKLHGTCSRMPFVDCLHIIPKDEPPKGFGRDSLHVVVTFPNFSTLSYSQWRRQGKTVLDLWDKTEKRNKFWTGRTTRFIIALGRLHRECDGLEIWIRSYNSRLFHINYFVDTLDTLSNRPIKFTAKTLIKVTTHEQS